MQRTLLASTAIVFLVLAPAWGAECPAFESRSEGLATQGEWRTHPDLGDVNGDGHLDLVAYPRKLKGPKVWLWEPDARRWKDSSVGLAIPGFTCGVGSVFAHLNDDEHLDLAVADHCSGVFAFLGNGGELWRLHASVLDRDRHGYDDLQVGDLDGDGNRDILAVGSFRGGFSLLQENAKGAFRSIRADKVGLPARGSGSDLDLGDVNGDGFLDVAAGFDSDSPDIAPGLNQNPIWLGSADGTFTPGGTSLFQAGRGYGVSLGDVNGDGLDDLAISRNEVPALQVFLSQADGSWKAASKGLPGKTRFHGVKLADVTGDGVADLVAMEHRNAAIRLFRGNGGSSWEECTETGLPAGNAGTSVDQRGWGVAVGDIDGNGIGDIVAGFGRNSEGSVQAWFGSPRGKNPAPQQPATKGD